MNTYLGYPGVDLLHVRVGSTKDYMSAVLGIE